MDTESFRRSSLIRSGGMRRAGRALSWCLAAALLLGSPVPSRGADSDRVSRNLLLWSRGQRSYVALSDTAHVEEGDSVRFEERGAWIAGGRVASVIGRELAVVSMTSGSLERVRKPDRVTVTTSRWIGTLSRLRVALPSGGRGNLIVPCDRTSLRTPRGAPEYAADPLDSRHVRLRKSPGSPGPWPDTLDVHLFDDASDEEIALERGDVDVAVFWPGELSRRIRDDARWSGFLHGTRDRGIVALIGDDGAAEALSEEGAAALNAELFHGDLGPRTSERPTARRGGPWTVDADGRLPGRLPIQQWLKSQGLLGSANRRPVGLARIAFVDAPPDTAIATGFRPLFSVRCPVVCAPSRRRLVEALGPDAFADLPQCAPDQRR